MAVTHACLGMLAGGSLWESKLSPQLCWDFSSCFFPSLLVSYQATFIDVGWLYDHGKHDRAVKALAKLHAHGDEDDPIVLAQMDEIKETSAHEGLYAAKSWAQLFQNKSTFRRLVLGLTIQAATQVYLSTFSADAR